MKKNFFDVRKLQVEGFWNDSIVTNPESFVHRKYISGRSNNSPESTNRGVCLALGRIMPGQDDDAFFGVHIRETIHQIRALFGRR